MSRLELTDKGSLELSVPDFESYYREHESEFMKKYRDNFIKDIPGMWSWPGKNKPDAVIVWRDERTGFLKYKW